VTCAGAPPTAKQSLALADSFQDPSGINTIATARGGFSPATPPGGVGGEGGIEGLLLYR
jgi:hypothetical protein